MQDKLYLRCFLFGFWTLVELLEAVVEATFVFDVEAASKLKHTKTKKNIKKLNYKLHAEVIIDK